MTLHYHGTPISPKRILLRLSGKCFCVSYAAPGQVFDCHEIGQSVLLDNGAFSFWKSGKPVNWPGFYRWAEPWLSYNTTWAVIPDVIDGTSEENDALLSQWPFGFCGAPVWHLHEPIERLLGLCDNWQKICFGSSGEYATVLNDAWRRRIDEAFSEISYRHARLPWIHMLRGMKLSGLVYPFSSVDSTDIARNHNRPQNDVELMAFRWDSLQCPATFEAPWKLDWTMP